jgi:hypothetical protein
MWDATNPSLVTYAFHIIPYSSVCTPEGPYGFFGLHTEEYLITTTNTYERNEALVPRDFCTKRENSRMRTSLHSRPP